MKEIADLFKALSDTTRLRIVYVLVKAGSKLCVCEIMDSLSASQYHVSRHLKILKVAGLVDEEKDGRWGIGTRRQTVMMAGEICRKRSHQQQATSIASSYRTIRTMRDRTDRTRAVLNVRRELLHAGWRRHSDARKKTDGEYFS